MGAGCSAGPHAARQQRPVSEPDDKAGKQLHIHSATTLVVVTSGSTASTSSPLEEEPPVIATPRSAGRPESLGGRGDPPLPPLNLPQQSNGDGWVRPRMVPLIDGTSRTVDLAPLPPPTTTDVVAFEEDTPQPPPEDNPRASARSSISYERVARMRMMPRSYSARFTIKPPAQRVVELLQALKAKYGFSADEATQIDEAIHLIHTNQLYVPTLLENGDLSRPVPASDESQDGEDEDEAEDEDKELQEWLSDQLDVKARATRSALGAPKPDGDKPPAATFKSVSRRLVMSLRITKILMTLARGLDSSGAAMDEKALNAALSESTCWDFNVFEVSRLTNGRPLFYTALSLFSKLGLNAKLNVDDGAMARFLADVESSYKPNPYHNNVHAADVLQTAFFFLTSGGLMEKLDDMEVFALLVSCCVHDMEHPGTNNQYQIKAETEFALLYNDASPLENHHASAAFRLMRQPHLNITARFSEEQKRDFRSRVISMVLATDMKQHFETVGNFKSRVASGTFGLANAADRQLLLNMCIKSADVSNPAKPYELSSKWADNVTEEFFAQGDLEKEKGLPLSPFCDRSKPAIPKSQIGFIDFIAIPMFEAWCNYLDVPEPLECLHANRNTWEQMLEAEVNRKGSLPGEGPAAGGGGGEKEGGMGNIVPQSRASLAPDSARPKGGKRRSSLYAYRGGTPGQASERGGGGISSNLQRALQRGAPAGSALNATTARDDELSAIGSGNSISRSSYHARDSARSGVQPPREPSAGVRRDSSGRDGSMRSQQGSPPAAPQSTGITSLVSVLKEPAADGEAANHRRSSTHGQHARFSVSSTPVEDA